MSEIRCPMCSKLNPADQDVCQFCQARLKPLQVQPSGDDVSGRSGDVPSSGESEEQHEWWETTPGIPDKDDQTSSQSADGEWIDYLRAEAPDTQIQGVSEWDSENGMDSGAEAETSDWLSRMRSQMPISEAEEDESLESEPAEEMESDAPETGALSDWVTYGDESEAPDWLLDDITQIEDVPAEPGEDYFGLASSPAEGAPSDEISTEEMERGDDVELGEDPSISPQAAAGLTGMLAFLKDRPIAPPSEDVIPLGEGEGESGVDEAPGFDTSAVDTPDEESGGLPDWIQEYEPEVEAQEKQTEALPDWLSEDEGEPGGIEGDDLPSEAESLPEWLKDEQVPAVETPESADAEIEPGELPDWLSAEEAESEALDAVLPVADSLDDEVSDLDAEVLPDSIVDEISPGEIPPPDQPEPDDQEAEDESLPDWLKEKAPLAGIATAAAAAAVIGSHGDDAPEEGAGDDELPDVLPPAEDADALEAETIPDWLSSSEEELPEWLAEDEDTQIPVSVSSDAEDETPEWLTEDDSQAEASTETPDQQDEDDVDEIMASLSHQSAVAAASLAVSEDEQVDDDLSWLDDLESAYPDIGEGEIPEAALMEGESAEQDQDGQVAGLEGELPDWYAEAAAAEGIGEAEEEGEIEGAASEDDLTPAELPSWLEAMRPVDSVGTAVAMVAADAEMEDAGPLAGLKGALKAEPDASYSSKIPAYSVKLRVTEKQETDAEVLRQLIDGEVLTQPIPSAPVISSQHILRIGIFLVLVLSILIPMILGIPQVAAPASPQASADALAVNELVEGVPGGSPVLVAIDYEPGLSGEMDRYTSVVLEHLMARGAYLTLVSTSPTGPLLANRLVEQINLAGNYQYMVPEQYLNLGFVPGGVAGLQSFATAPQQTSPITLDGKLAWQDTPLTNVGSLSEFALVLVATENPDTARAWIEQVQPKLSSTPMVVVASAQAEPVVRPYYQANPQQIQGLLSGLAASSIYSNLAPSQSLRDYWTPFSIAVLAAGALILIGGGLLVGMKSLGRRDANVKGDE